jgi:uncharacterized protein with NAD-binding domain and iron-sulfur cluster
MTSPSAIVIGGGVGGLTAAHELALRGFSVDVYDTRPTFGGKARSQPLPGSGAGGRADLPGEHGFRFYPRFYQHVPDTMSRIPSPLGGSVKDHLLSVTQAAIARANSTGEITFERAAIDKPYDLLQTLEIFFDDLHFDDEDVSLFGMKLLQFATSCDERRLGDYEGVSWFDFLDAPECSPEFQRQLRGIPRMLVAMDAMRGSARTVGVITMQLLLDFATTGVNNDRTMSGPTTELWIDPWLAELGRLGVRLHPSTQLASLQVSGGRVAGVTLAGGAAASADYYVLAVPLDVVIPLLAATPALTALDPALARLAAQNPDDLVQWMVGIQFYLYEDVPLVRGHTFYPDAPWALTSISQPQFWRGRGLFRRLYGDGEVGGLISVDISEWDTPGTFVTKPAKQCTPAEIASEVWQQLKAAVNVAGGVPILTDDLLVRSHIDDDLNYAGGIPPINSSRLLVHPPGSWAIRPQAGTAVPNLVLASDYVRTYTNIASMEGANEAARRAVNAILDHAGSTAARAQLWPMVEPARFDRAKRLDAWLYRHGKRHVFELLGLENAAKAGVWLRRFEAAVGIHAFDEWFDKTFQATKIIKAILEALGVPIA